MKLLDIEISGVRGAPDGKYELAKRDGAPHPLTVVTGPDGCGKTSLLEAIVIAKEVVGNYGLPVLAPQVLRQGGSSATLIARWLLTDTEHAALRASEEPEAEVPQEVTTHISVEEELCLAKCDAVDARALGQVFGTYRASSEHSKLEYFPARRHIHSELWREHPGDLDRVREAVLRVSKDASKYGFVRTWFFDLVVAEGMRMQEILATEGMLVPSEDLDLLAPFKRALATLSQSIRLQHVEAGKGDRTRVWFVRRSGGVVELQDLSDSETQAVIFAATFIRQGLEHSMVLVDRPELFIEPERQASFLQAIIELAPDNQIIAATNSPALASHPKAHILDLSPSP